MKSNNGSINIVKIILITIITIAIAFIAYKLIIEDTKYYTVVNGQITKSQIKDAVTEEMAREKLDILLNAFTEGEYTSESADAVQYAKDGEVYWEFENNEYKARINAINCKVIYYKDKYDITQIESNSSKEEAEIVLQELIEKYNIPSEYKIQALERDQIGANTSIWDAKLCKRQNGVYNEYQQVELEFIPENKRVILLKFRNYEYTNNEITITEEQAKQIAQDSYDEPEDIASITTEKSIEQITNKKISSEIYLGDEIEISSESELLEYMQKYKETRQIRNAWKVIITNKNGDTAEYAIDATTGELIKKAFTKNNK